MPPRLPYFIYIYRHCAFCFCHFSHQVSAVRAPADSGVDEEIAEIRRRHQLALHQPASSSATASATASLTPSSSSECSQSSIVDNSLAPNTPSVAPLPQGNIFVEPSLFIHSFSSFIGFVILCGSISSSSFVRSFCFLFILAHVAAPLLFSPNPESANSQPTWTRSRAS